MKASRTKLIVTITLLVVAIFSAIGVTVGWYVKYYKISTGAKVEVDYVLYIGAGNQDNISEFSFGKIDATDNTNTFTEGGKDYCYKNYVFCVIEEKKATSYKLQIAHTTNLAFKYRIYESEELSSTPASVDDSIAVYTSLAGTYYYEAGDKVIDSTPEYNVLPTSSVYDSYTNVQLNAYAKYYQSELFEPTDEELLAKGLVRYYMFQLYWEEGTIENNKETDIVYITAEQSS